MRRCAVDHRDIALGPACLGASAFLEAAAAQGFPEAQHKMRFPRWAGFSGPRAEQCATMFGPAILADLLLDCATLSPGPQAARWRAIARGGADRVAQARLRDRPGGWSYFPDLPELPPDLDSLAVATRLFARAAPHHLPLVENPIRLALDAADGQGAIKTWILAPQTDPKTLKRMRRGVRRHWGDTVDIEVCARFYLALQRMNRGRFDTAIHRGTQYVAGAQKASGDWTATWYAGPVYGTALCTELMASADHARARDAGLQALATLEHPEGGWGTWEPVPLDTAIALAALAETASDAVLARGVAVLLRYQNPDGSWPGTPWIQMDAGRAGGPIKRRITWQSDTITTGFALRALLLAEQRLGRTALAETATARCETL